MPTAKTPLGGDEESRTVSETIGHEPRPAEAVPNSLDAIEATFGPVPRVSLRDEENDSDPAVAFDDRRRGPIVSSHSEPLSDSRRDRPRGHGRGPPGP